MTRYKMVSDGTREKGRNTNANIQYEYYRLIQQKEYPTI